MNFTIVESANGEYFTFTDTTGNYNVTTNPTGWGTPNYNRSDLYPMRLVVSYTVSEVAKTSYYTFTTTTEADVIALQAGIDIEPSNLTGDTLTGDTFEDNIYSFKVQLYIDAGWRDTYSTTYITNSVTEGFAAIITGKKIKEFSNYRIYLDYRIRNSILDNLILTTNLANAASTGNTTAFSENLLTLQKLD